MNKNLDQVGIPTSQVCAVYLGDGHHQHLAQLITQESGEEKPAEDRKTLPWPIVKRSSLASEPVYVAHRPPLAHFVVAHSLLQTL